MREAVIYEAVIYQEWREEIWEETRQERRSKNSPTPAEMLFSAEYCSQHCEANADDRHYDEKAAR